MAHRRNLRNENTESEPNCGIESDDYVEDTESDEGEDY
jgi:hypothetical protein